MDTRPVLDTDVLIDYLRGVGPGRDLIRVLGPSLAYRVTTVSAFELALGRSYGDTPAPVDALLSVPSLPLSRAAAIRAGGLLRSLREKGRGLDIRDAMQAGICLEAQLPLVTRNRDHFERVEGLDVVGPDEWLARSGV